MESLAASLVRSGVASSFEISEDDGLKLRVHREVDDGTASVTMTGTTEAYILNLNDVYTTARTAYDDDYKWDVLDDFFGCIEAFMERDYHEEIGERNGRVVSRVIYLNVPGGPRSVSALGGWRAGIGRILGYKKSVVRPVEC
jgi:hypothetical protein